MNGQFEKTMYLPPYFFCLTGDIEFSPGLYIYICMYKYRLSTILVACCQCDITNDGIHVLSRYVTTYN